MLTVALTKTIEDEIITNLLNQFAWLEIQPEFYGGTLPMLSRIIVSIFLLMLLIEGQDSAFAAKNNNRVRQSSTKPNVIVIYTDDLGYGDLGSYGQRMIRTPHLDEIASAGMRFTNFYSAHPVCGPARGSLMTGRNIGHAYIRTNASPDHALRPEDLTVAELFKSRGYATGMVGKWGLGGPGSTGTPNRKGFDQTYCFLEHAEGDYFPSYLWRNDKREEIPAKTYQQKLFTDDAMRFVREQKGGPFFLYLAYMVPHSPYVRIPGYHPYEEELWTDEEKNFASMISYLDQDVGQLTALLKELGIDQNTLVLFSSDNGPEANNIFNSTGSLRGIKRTLYEGGIRVPMLAWWPGTIKPGVADEPFAMYDFMATVLDLLQADSKVETEGASMLPAFFGLPIPPREHLYWEFYIKNDPGWIQAVRMGRWKGVRVNSPKLGKRQKKSVELYDLWVDPAEEHNLGTDPLYRDIVQRMLAIMKQEHTEPVLPTGQAVPEMTHH